MQKYGDAGHSEKQSLVGMVGTSLFSTRWFLLNVDLFTAPSPAYPPLFEVPFYNFFLFSRFRFKTFIILF